jgi:hypothetical protein
MLEAGFNTEVRVQDGGDRFVLHMGRLFSS